MPTQLQMFAKCIEVQRKITDCLKKGMIVAPLNNCPVRLCKRAEQRKDGSFAMSNKAD